MLDYTIITNRTEKFTKTVRKLWISERKNCKYLSRTCGQFNCENSLRRIFDFLSSYKENLMQLFCDTLGRNFNLFERFENQAVHSWSKRGWISALHKSLRKVGVKNRFFPSRIFRRGFTLQITYKAIYSPWTIGSDMHPKYFTFAYFLVSVLLYTNFKALAFIINKPVIQTWKVCQTLLFNFSDLFMFENYASIISIK